MSGTPQPFNIGREGPLLYLARQIRASKMHEDDKRHVLLAIKRVREDKHISDVQAMDLRIQLSAYGESLRVYRRMSSETVENKAYQSCVVAYYKLVQILRNQRSDRKMAGQPKPPAKRVPVPSSSHAPEADDDRE